MEYSIHKQVTQTDELYCVNCNSKHKISIYGNSSWSLLVQCKTCGWKHEWAFNDMMGGATHTYSLYYNGKDWSDEQKQDILNKLDVLKNTFNKEIPFYENFKLSFGSYKLEAQSPKLIEEKYITDNLEDIVWVSDGYWYHKNQVLDQKK